MPIRKRESLELARLSAHHPHAGIRHRAEEHALARDSIARVLGVSERPTAVLPVIAFTVLTSHIATVLALTSGLCRRMGPTRRAQGD